MLDLLPPVTTPAARRIYGCAIRLLANATADRRAIIRHVHAELGRAGVHPEDGFDAWEAAGDGLPHDADAAAAWFGAVVATAWPG